MLIARRVATAIVLLLLIAPASQAQESTELSLATAVAAARARNPAVAAAFLTAEAAAHRTSAVGKWTNPDLTVYQENFPGALPDADQWIVTVSQRVRIGGQLGLATEAAAADEKALGADAAAVRWRIGLRVQQEYVAGHGRQQQLEALAAAADGVRSLHRDIEARASAGDASEYEVRRLRQALEAIEVRALVLRSESRDGDIRLAALTGLVAPDSGWTFASPEGQPGGPPSLVAAADLDRDDPPAPADGSVGSRPDVAAAEHRFLAAGLAADLARRQSIPDLVLVAGYTRLDPGFDGFVWSVSAALPVFARSREEAAALAVEQARRERDIEVLRLEAGVEVQQAAQGYRAATSSLRSLDARMPAELASIARAAYQEGEMTVMEFVDALRTDLESRTRRIELARVRAERWFAWRWALGEGSDGGQR